MNKSLEILALKEKLYSFIAILHNISDETSRTLRFFESFVPKSPEHYFKKDEIIQIKNEALVSINFFEVYIGDLLQESKNEKETRNLDMLTHNFKYQYLLEFYESCYSEQQRSSSNFILFLETLLIEAKNLGDKLQDYEITSNLNQKESAILQILLIDSLHYLDHKEKNQRKNLGKYLRKSQDYRHAKRYQENFAQNEIISLFRAHTS